MPIRLIQVGATLCGCPLFSTPKRAGAGACPYKFYGYTCFNDTTIRAVAMDKNYFHLKKSLTQSSNPSNVSDT